MAATKRDYYEILGVGRTATDDEIKKAYRKLAVKFHPDKNAGDKVAEEKFKELGEAYEILGEPQKRAAYDQYGHAAFDPRMRAGSGGRSGGGAGSGFHDPMDIFREVFGGGEAGGIFESLFGNNEAADPSGAQRGADLRYDLEITLEEAFSGTEKQITLKRSTACANCQGSGAELGSRKTPCMQCAGRGRVVMSRGIFSIQQTCPRCSGAGQVLEKPCRTCSGQGRRDEEAKVTIRVPAGVDTGMRLRSAGNGDAGVRGGTRGDLYVMLKVRDHDVFARDGTDLHCEAPITFAQAALGTEIDIPTLSGKAQIRIPAGTQAGTTFRLKGRGVKDLQGNGNGDLLIRVQVEVPTKLNPIQRQKLEEFAKLCDAGVNPQSRSFFERAKSFFG